MKGIIGSIALLLAAGCASLPDGTGGSRTRSTGDFVRYECYTYVGSKHVLTLPVAPRNAEIGVVNATFHGEQLEAAYIRDGLTQLWTFEQGLYVQLGPDFTASYMDFRNADDGEMRKPEAVFECKKRR